MSKYGMRKLTDWANRHTRPNPIYWRLILRQAKGWPLTTEEKQFLAARRNAKLNIIVGDGGRPY